jgi:sugar phosphate isomerase/epimerase
VTYLLKALSAFGTLVAGTVALATPPFFVMDTCIARAEPSVALPLIKQIGFDGFGDSEKNVLSNLPLLARERMRLVNVYFVFDLAPDRLLLKEDLRIKLDQLAESGPTALWVAIQHVSGPAGPFASSDVSGDELVLEKLKELNAYARPRNLRIALYPHAQFWLQRVEDAARIARAMDDANVGITFNLCHWLKMEGDRDPAPILRATLPLLYFVTINGADRGETQSMEWNRLIQPLGEGDYDVGAFLTTLETAGYRGPIGLQGFGIPGDPAENLIKSFSAWKRFAKTFTATGKE